MELADDVRRTLVSLQKTEITEHHVYARLAARVTGEQNRELLLRIAADERRHYEAWRRYTGQEVQPSRWKVWIHYWITRLLGLTFGIKLMERGEVEAQDHYELLRGVVSEIESVIREENEHERALIALIDEERLRYVGSIVLGLNDALVELTGTLAGLTLALRNTRLIALTGLITGLAAGLSMATSEYLSTKAEEKGTEPLKAAVYTGSAYVVTVAFLILPYLVLANYFVCLAWTLTLALVIIAVFNYYVAVAKDKPFGRRFLEMAAVSLGVAALSFGVGFLVRVLLGVEI